MELHQQSSPDSLPSNFTPSSEMKTYNMYYTTSRTNVRLHLGSSSSPCVYYGEGSLLTVKPQIRLRSGDSKSAPMVAVAKIHLTSRHILLGTGDYQKDSEDSFVWEEMRREKTRLQRSDYEFDTSVGLGPRRTYSWRVDHHMTKTAYRCVDDAGQVVANMRSGGMCDWRKGGELDVAEGLEKEFEELLVVSALAIWMAEAGWSVHSAYGSGAAGAHSGSADAKR